VGWRESEMVDEYEVKEGCEASTQDFWYDLTKGGYLKPDEILVNQKDIDEVMAAIAIVEKFERSCDNQIEGFIQ
jgi:hypothetical protein